MTDIQAQSLPQILLGKDVIGQAKTGSGKTAAFGLGILNKLKVKQFRIQTLVLCPTRELADQVAKEIRRLARTVHNIKVLTLCGGSAIGPQIGSLEHGAHIIVGTPGRIEDHLRRGKLKLEHLETFVLDEADRMLDMGFQSSLDAILDKIPKQRQTLLFSATFPAQIKLLSEKLMQHPVMVHIKQEMEKSNIEQVLYKVDADTSRIGALHRLLLHYRPLSTLIFCNTKVETKEVADGLCELGFSCLALHGDLDQNKRDQTLVRFSNNSISVLVATDVAARGLDIDALDAVFNYHVAREMEVHIHRIGRTGRAGRTGIACSLYSDKENYKIGKLEEYLQLEFTRRALPLPGQFDQKMFTAPMATLQIDGGRKQKVRPGDILGALTADKTIKGTEVGKISTFDNWTYIAVRSDIANQALKLIENGKLKGRSFRVRRIRG